ncbi:MAG: hypothetical protein QXI87_08025 [Thermoproteota archaeon]
MSYNTRISLRGLDESTRQKVLEACRYCEKKDKYKSFIYKLSKDGNTITIISPTREIAYKRGNFFKKRFHVFFNIIRESKTNSL